MMEPHDLSDHPLSEPGEDLVGITAHTSILANFIQQVDLPFTLGIYGAWGAGKTTFANLLVNELLNDRAWEGAHYLKFTAWPYVTADAVWRALLERIARFVYSQDPQALATESVDHGASSQRWLRRTLLARPFAVASTGPDTNSERYRRLLRRFDRTASIANKTSVDGPSRDIAMALANLALDTAAGLVPAVSPLRRLLPQPTTPAQGIGAAVPSVAQSVEEVRRDIRIMFKDAPDKRLVVLLDDLDRCLPEVALDVLETIKTFFFESAETAARCLFIIAADERLIARGLKARLGDDAELVAPIEARSYLEKIVQLGVTIPDVGIPQAARLIAAWSPEWAPAADLVASALDSNPRRVKQQCAILSYRFMAQKNRPSDFGAVEPAADEGLQDDHRLALDKLIRLNALSSDAFRLVADKCHGPRKDLQGLRALEVRHDLKSESDSLHEELDGFATQVVNTVVGPPTLSTVSARTLAVLASVADMSVGSDGVPETEDRIFGYIYRVLASEGGTTTSRGIHVSFVQRLLRLKTFLPEVLTALKQEAATDPNNFAAVTRGFDDWLDSVLRGTHTTSDEASEGGRLVDLCRPLIDDDQARTELVSSPRISEIPIEHVLFFKPYESLATTRGFAEVLLAASAAASKIVAHVGAALAPLEDAVVPRLAVSKEILLRRKFAKVQMLQSRWPELFKLVATPGGSRRLNALESVARGSDDGASLPDSWEAFLSDDRLERFFGLPPHFSDIFAAELASLAAEPGHDTTGPAESISKPETLYDNTPVPYDELELQLEMVRETVTADGDGLGSRGDEREGSEEERSAVRIRLVVPGDGEIDATVMMPLGAIEQNVSMLEELFVRQGMTPPTRDAHVTRQLSAEAVLDDVGSALWESSIGSDERLSSELVKKLQGPNRVRMMVFAERRLAGLPWEALYLPSHRVFAGQTLKTSVIRGVSDPARFVVRRVTRPLKIQVVAASSNDAPLESMGQEIELLRRALLPATESGAVKVDIVKNATNELWRARLRSFEPHIFHFVGHGFSSESGGFLVLEREDGTSHHIDAGEVGLTLQDHGILLALLNGCATGVAGTGGLARSVGQVLVEQGVPAVVATTRVILDNAALVFTGELYRALVDGYSVESAIIEARKALSIKGLDWSAYVTYASREFHANDLRILAQRSGGGES